MFAVHLIQLLTTNAVLLPFLLCVLLRPRYVRGTRPRAVLNAVVVNLRPFIRPAAVLDTLCLMLVHADRYTGGKLAANLVIDAVPLLIWWKWAERDRGDDDDDDPWQRRRAAFKAWASSLTPAPRTASNPT